MLNKTNDIVSSLDSREVRYCHWKSNEMLQEALHGSTDLDLLCHKDDERAFREVLNQHGFVRLDDVVFTGYPGIENYVGHDPETGCSIHVHLHFELTLGTPFIKEYVTPWGPYILNSRITDTESGVPITDPTTELFLLVVRYGLKIRRYNLVTRQSYFQEFLEEYDWLAKRANESELKTITHDLLSPASVVRIRGVLNENPTIRDLVKFGQTIRPELDAYSTYPTWSTTPVALARKGFRGVGKFNRDFLNRPYPSRRKLPSRGVEIAIIGIDGSGKSTHLSSLYDWLSWKMDLHSVYLGSGDGPSSLLRYPLKKFNDLRSSSSGGESTTHGNGSAGQYMTTERADSGDRNDEVVTDGSLGIAKAIWGILLAREKHKKRRRATQARNRGMIVLMDRYPQNQFEGINDGPLLQAWADSGSKLLEMIATWEREIYADLEVNSPDLVIKLVTDPEVAKKRKPETPMSNLQRKAEIIESLEYENSRVVTVDTHQDIEDVLKKIKKKVWTEI